MLRENTSGLSFGTCLVNHTNCLAFPLEQGLEIEVLQAFTL
jgi:hypothetical protein